MSIIDWLLTALAIVLGGLAGGMFSIVIVELIHRKWEDHK